MEAAKFKHYDGCFAAAVVAALFLLPVMVLADAAGASLVFCLATAGFFILLICLGILFFSGKQSVKGLVTIAAIEVVLLALGATVVPSGLRAVEEGNHRADEILAHIQPVAKTWNFEPYKVPKPGRGTNPIVYLDGATSARVTLRFQSPQYGPSFVMLAPIRRISLPKGHVWELGCEMVDGEWIPWTGTYGSAPLAQYIISSRGHCPLYR